MSSVRMAGLLGLFCAALALSQETTAKQARQTLSIDVDLVLVNASVTDKENRNVTSLQQKDFRVWEDKVEQQVEYFSTEDVPLSVGILLDVSGSMKDKLKEARSAANLFLSMGDSDDEYFLIEFSDQAALVQEFTKDRTRIGNQLLHIEARGETAVYDAVYLGLETVKHGSNARKALLLITDGIDNHSRYSIEEVRRAAKERDVILYTIGVVPAKPFTLAGFGDPELLQDLAKVTGGAAFFIKSVDSLLEICERIGRDLKSQYLLGYRPHNLSSDGKWRKIRVKINKRKGMPEVSVRAKSGYFGAAGARATK